MTVSVASSAHRYSWMACDPAPDLMPTQPSLLDQGVEPELVVLDRGLQRRQLTAGAWVDHRAGWLRGSVELLEALLRRVPWRAERRQMYDRVVAVPRLVCWYGEDDEMPHPVLAQARQELSEHYAAELREPFRTAGLCLYRDGQDSVAWHGDTIGRGARENTMVAILSVGEARPLHLRPRGGGTGLQLPLGHGDLVVMGGSCQRTWEHSIPKTARPVGPRVSIQFRPAGVS